MNSSYIGNEPTTTDFLVDYISGNNTVGPFLLTVAPATVNAIEVNITGAGQSPLVYSLNGNYITFVSPVPVGTNNIVVRHLGVMPITQPIINSFPFINNLGNSANIKLSTSSYLTFYDSTGTAKNLSLLAS